MNCSTESGAEMPSDCLVRIPASKGSGHHEYSIPSAHSSMAAAGQAIALHEGWSRQPLEPDAIVTVIVGGVSSEVSNSTEHDAKQPTYRHLVGKVRHAGR